MHRFCCLIALGFLLSTGANAQNSENAATVLAAFRQASGGDAWNGVRSLHVTTMISSGGQHFRGEHWEDVITGRYLVRQMLPSYVAQEGFDGITPWRKIGSGTAYTLGDVDSTEGAADDSFRASRSWWFRIRHPATIALLGVRQQKGHSFDVLDITPEGGRPFEVWIDRATHLLARTEEQQAEELAITEYSDYRRVHGIMVPFTIRSDDDVETIQSVEINPRISDGLYSIPPRPPSDIVLPPGRDSVDVPFRLTGDNRILVAVTIDGRRTVEAEFDSGGSLILQPSLVSALRLRAAGRATEHGGGEGSTVESKGVLESMALGGASVRNLAFHSFAFDSDHPDEALVGLEILQRFVVHIDFDRNVMTLTRPDAFVYRGKDFVIPFHFQDNQPEVEGSIDGVSGRFTVDTGDNSSLLLIAPFARRYGLVARYQADLPYGGKAVTATHGVWARRRVGTVAFDGPDGRPLVEVHNPITRISLQHSGFDANRDVSANIGLGILRQFNLTFDYVRQRLILAPSHFFGKKEAFNRTGLSLEHDDSNWTVISVSPGSPAAGVKVKPGDVLTKVNGKPADRIDRATLWALMRGAAGTKLQLDLRSKGTIRHVTLSLRDIL